MAKPKLLITGILGYVGIEVAKRYSKTKKYDLIGVDNNFNFEKVDWLTHNNIKFYHKSIFEIENLLKQADIVIHTAGVTKVPLTKDQSNPAIDSEITKIGTDGTRKIISEISNNCLFVFLSTHVVFEGNEYNTPFREMDIPIPILAYSKSKRQSEIDLLNSGKNFIITRLASIYGDNQSIRWNILPNLFSKMTSENQNLKIFGKDNVKPLIGITDVARCIDFLISKKLNNQIFHLVNEHKTVEEIAKICQKHNPNIELNFTNDAVPNSGYRLSNDKLLNCGFNFTQTLETEIEKMIHA